jgi:GR25 family glycosyltransferase involved in LPS biosynthesis
MKSYVITIMDNEDSVRAAQRCIESMPEYNVQMFPAITPKDNPIAIAEQRGIPTNNFEEIYSKFENCLAAFLSHNTLWERCARDKEEYQIFEHDAVAVSPIPKLINHNGCISLGKPSYGRYNTPPILGVNKLVSKKYFPGAHAYRLKPKGAQLIIESARMYARPTDVFLNLDLFPWLQEYYPWAVEARDTFTTIQNRNGCFAKHNYKEGYEIVSV